METSKDKGLVGRRGIARRIQGDSNSTVLDEIHPISKGRAKTTRRDAILEEELKVGHSALKALSREGKKNLLALVREGPQIAALAIRMLNAVNRSSPGRENELMKKFRTYPGSPVILETFLNNLGVDDPFLATERAQVVLLPIERLPGQAVVSADEEDRAIAADSVRGASGHVIKGMIYCAYDRESPVATAGFFSKRQAVLRPFETFNPEKFNVASRAATKERRGRSYVQILQDLSLADLENDPKLVSDSHSPVLARDFAVYQELKRAVAAFRDQYKGLLYGEDKGAAKVECLNVRTDLGGTFFGWFERQIEAGLDIPAGLLAAYHSLKDPDVYLEPETERDYIRGLLAFQKVHSFIRKDVALAGAKSDLAAFDDLPDDDPLRVNSQIQQARRSVEELAHTAADELRVSEFATLVSLGGLSELRREMNFRVLALYGKEFQEALKYFRPFMMTDGRWNEDCLGDSVPMSRLSKTLYGERIGVAKAWHSADERRALLGQPDFKQVREALFHWTIAEKDSERLLLAMPISSFRAVVEKFIGAYRKAKYMDERLKEYLAERITKGLAEIVVDKGNVGVVLDDWKPPLPIGTDLKPAEALTESATAKVLPLRELVACIKCRGLGGKEVRSAIREIEMQAEAGLYSANFEVALRALQNQAVRYTSAESLSAELASIREMLRSPFVRVAEYHSSAALAKSHLSNPEALQVRTQAGFKVTFDNLGLDSKRTTRELKADFDRYSGASIVEGGLWSVKGSQSIGVRVKDFPAFADEKCYCGLAYFTPETLRTKFAELNSNFVCAASLPADWFTRAQLLCSARGKEVLNRNGLQMSDRETYYAAMSLRRDEKVYMAKALVEAVNRICPAKEESGSLKRVRTGRIGPTNHFVWQTAEGKSKVIVNFGRHSGQPLFSANGSITHLRYLSEFVLKRDFPKHVHEIAEKLVELSGTPAATRERSFYSWLDERVSAWSK